MFSHTDNTYKPKGAAKLNTFQRNDIQNTGK